MKPILVRYYDRILLHESSLAVRRARSARRRRRNELHGAASFTGIVTAAASTEAYLSEILAHLTRVGRLGAGERDKIRGKNRLWKRLNALVKRFHKNGLAQDPMYVKFQALVNLRNCLIHRSAEFLRPGVWPEDIRNHRQTIPHVAGPGLDWTSQVLDADTAEWARSVGAGIVKIAKRYVPDPAKAGSRAGSNTAALAVAGGRAARVTR
jgi:hypothetical protein